MSNDSVFTCPPLSSAFLAAKDNANSFAYEILPYPYFILGIIGHARLLYSCHKQSKSEPAYLLQAFFSVVKALEIISFMLLTFVFNRWASHAVGGGAAWYRSNMLLMRFAAHLIIPLVNGFINTSVLVTVCIALDRVLAIAKPQVYRQKWQNRRYRIGAPLLSLFVGFAVVSYDAGRLYLSYDNTTGLYKMEDDLVYQNSNAGVVFTVLRNVVDIGGVSALIFCNIAIIRLYRSKVIKSMPIFDHTRSVADVEREARRKEAERTLLLLSVCQSVIATLSIGFMITLYMAQYTLTEAQRRSGVLDIGWPICDAGLQVAAVLDFYVPVFISKPLRRIVFPWYTRDTAKITSVQVTASRQQVGD